MKKDIYYLNCLRCGRKLSNPESQLIGMGKVCYKKSNDKKQTHLLFDVSKLLKKSIVNKL